MFKLYLMPKEVWAFGLSNAERLEKEQVTIAEDKSGMTVCLTLVEDELYIVVYFGEKFIYGEKITNDTDAVATTSKVYREYLDVPKDVLDSEPDEKSEKSTHEDLEDTIYEREDELYLATCDYLETLLCIEKGNVGDIVRKTYGLEPDEFLDKVCETLAEEFCISVYRPTFVKNDEAPDGEVYDEYPYDEIIDEFEAGFDEEDDEEKGSEEKGSEEKE